MIKLYNKFREYFIKVPVDSIFRNKKPFRENISTLLPDGNSHLYRFIFILIFFILIVGMPILSLDFGRNSDETISNAYGKDILNYFLSGGKDQNVFNMKIQGYSHMLYYGLSFDFLCAVVNKVSPLGEFETRHILNVLFGFMAIFFAALIARRLANWRAAIMTLLFMFLSPQFLGYSMNNAKDIPFAAGYIMAIYYMIKFLESLPKPKTRTFIFLILGIGITASNKINGVILLAYLALFLLLIWLIPVIKTKSQNYDFPKLKSFSWYIVIIGFFSYILAVIFWPYAQQDLVNNVIESVKKFENIGQVMIHYELFEGNRINMVTVPWYYTFKLMWITIPIFVIAGFLITILFSKWTFSKYRGYIIGMLLFITFFPILYAIYKHSKLYNGWRHFLFIYPSFVVIASLGWEFALTIIKKKYFKYALLVLLVFSMLKTSAWMIKNHPNEVVYFNEFEGGVDGAYSYYETDPLTNCGRQAIEWLIKNTDIKSRKLLIVTNIEPESVKYYAKKYADNLTINWTRDYNKGEQNWDYALFVTRGMSHSQLTKGSFPPKGTIHLIQADHTPLVAIVKKLNENKYKGYQLYENRNYDQAIFYFSKAVQEDSLDEEALVMLGSCYSNIAKSELAQYYTNKALQLYKEDFIAYNNIGTAEYNKGNYRTALNLYLMSLNYRLNWRSSQLNVGKTYYVLKNYDSALYYFDLADHFNPKDIEIYLNVAAVYAAQGNEDLAVETYDKILEMDPGNVIALSNRRYNSNKSRNSRFSKELELAKHYSEINKIDSTISILTSIIAQDPENLEALLNRGVSFIYKKDYKSAITDFDHILKVDSTNYNAMLKKAQAYINMNKTQLAFEYLGKCLYYNPVNTEAFNERGNLYYTLGKYELAVQDYSSCLKINPNQYACLYSRALIYYKEKDYSLSLQDLNQAIHVYDKFTDAYVFRSMVWYAIKNYKNALQDLLTAKSLGYTVNEGYMNSLRNLAKP